MQYLSGETPVAQTQQKRRRARVLLWIVLGGIALLFSYSAIFRWLMAREGQTHDWSSALYWTITTMSTLGYGDITFDSAAGRLFSMLVLITGVLLILVLLPYLFIQFVVTPWIAERDKARAPRRVPENLRGHLLLIGLDAVNRTLIARAKRTKTPTVVLVDDPVEASRLKDDGYQAMVGSLDSPTTYRRAGVDRALMVVSTQADTTNTNVAFTVRAVSENVRIIVTADKKASRDVLKLAGADHVVQLSSTLGTELANRILGTTGRSHVIDTIGETHVAEAATKGTALVGLTVAQAQDRIASQAQILAVMRRGRLLSLESDAELGEDMVLIIAGTRDELAAYDDQFQNPQQLDGPVLILGGGRVGRAVAETFEASDIPYTIVEQVPSRVPEHLNHIEGDAADFDVLEDAGLHEASGVVITSHDDDLNVYLTLYCHRLRPDIQVISRATSEHNVATLYRAGADSVLSYAAIGATAIWNKLGRSHRVLIAEGQELFTVPLPRKLDGITLRDTKVLEATGCHIVGAFDEEHRLLATTEHISAAEASTLLLLGDRHAERAFRQRYIKHR